MRSGNNNQEEIWFSQHSLLYSFPASIYCSFPGKNKGFKKTLKRVMKFLRVLSTNLPWNVGGTWEKNPEVLGKWQTEDGRGTADPTWCRLEAQHPGRMVCEGMMRC